MYYKQESLVAKHAKKSKIPYEIPKALEATTAILMHYVETGEALYTDKLGEKWRTYTRCQEKVSKYTWQVAIGGFSSGGLDVTRDDRCGSASHRRYGVGCVQKF